jgi:hypothetical protein
MQKKISYWWVTGFYGVLAAANAQAQAPSAAGAAFDGTYRVVSAASLNPTYVDRNGRMGPCPNRKPGPLHIENGRVRYATASGYKLRGTVGPQGELMMGLVAPPNSSNAGSQPLNLNVTGQIDSTGTARVRQSGHSCSYDFVWQKAGR